MDFVMIANAWDAGIDNPTSKHQIALELLRRGNNVLWVEGSGMRRPSLGSGSDRRKMFRKVNQAVRGAIEVGSAGSGRLWVLPPLFVPLPTNPIARGFNGWLCRTATSCWSRKLGFSDPVLINYSPVLAAAMKHWPGGTIYHCVDKWDAFGMYDSRMMFEMDAQCCRYAGIVIASSRDLYERCKKLNPNTHLVTHGVDYEHFAEALEQRTEDGGKKEAETRENGESGKRRISNIEHPISNTQGKSQGTSLNAQGSITEDRGRRADKGQALTINHEPLATNHRPRDLPKGMIVGFFGLLSEWIDQDLLVRLAAELTEAHIVLIGKADVPTDKLKSRRNIHVLGSRTFKDLPMYVAHFDVGIIPFVVNELTRAVNPIKLREMLAAGCPVVSTALPEVEALLPLPGIRVAHSHDEFVRFVKDLLGRPPTMEDRRRISDSMKDETWRAKVDEILEIIGST